MADASSPKARERRSSGWVRPPQVRARVPATAAWRTRSSRWWGRTEIRLRRCCNDARLLAGGADRIAEIRPHEELFPFDDSVPADVLLLLRIGDGAASFVGHFDRKLRHRYRSEEHTSELQS